MWEQREAVNLTSSDKKNTQRIMGGSLDIAKQYEQLTIVSWDGIPLMSICSHVKLMC